MGKKISVMGSAKTFSASGMPSRNAIPPARYRRSLFVNMTFLLPVDDTVTVNGVRRLSMILNARTSGKYFITIGNRSPIVRWD
jgi:hypothetical protein